MSATIDYGIDLGTTNSSIALCRRGEVRVFQTTELMSVTPSVVYVSKSGKILVGKRAYEIWRQDPENTQAEFKRWMGYSDKVNYAASGRQVSAEELSAEVLKSLRADAERHTQEKIDAAVITVPAAFGSLQCEATARAARLAGLNYSPLLQEPIAAAVAYGASPSARNRRWMTFDLGGGTLDIAIISTRNDRLAVLEHQGNNRLGGKDIDRIIAETFLLAPLRATFNLPDEKANPQEFGKLMRALFRQAEQAKIALSTAPSVTIDLFDIGEDRDGKPIEASLTLDRAEVNSKLAPVLDRCIDLARQALAGARLASADLDRILLVGGPTQMPVIREALESSLGVKLDHSLDPMTVVAYGAALYASTLEKPSSAASPKGKNLSGKAAAGGPVRIELAYERASGTARSPVAGVLDAASVVHEVKIDAGGGFWSSGWLPAADGCFGVDVTLQESKPATNYILTARDRLGNLVKVEPAEFTITYMLPMAAPPLPHTMAIELSTTHGVVRFDPVFKRHVPLPAEARKTYKADRTLRPSEIDSTLPIKFWEIEVSNDPQERCWAGCVHIRADQIRRPIPEGSDLELTIRIDASRKMTVEVFVPMLDQSFSNAVYIPDPTQTRPQLQQQLDLCFERLNYIHQELYAKDRGDLAERVAMLQTQAEEIAEEMAADARPGDPDAALAPTEALRKLRIRLTQVEEQLNLASGTPTMARKLRWQVPYVERVVRAHGTDSEKREFEKVRSQYDRYSEADDTRGLKWIHSQIWGLHSSIVEDQAWYWQDRLEMLKSPGQRFLNREQAASAIEDAEAANRRGDLAALRSACRRAFVLLPPDQLEAARDQETQSGLRTT